MPEECGELEECRQLSPKVATFRSKQIFILISILIIILILLFFKFFRVRALMSQFGHERLKGQRKMSKEKDQDRDQDGDLFSPKVAHILIVHYLPVFYSP